MTPEWLAAKRRIAEAATQAEWKAVESGESGVFGLEGPKPASGYDSRSATFHKGFGRADAEHMAAFDPLTVLAMLGEIERLQRIESAAKRVRATHPYDHSRVAGLCDCSLCELNAALDGGKVGDAK